MVQYDVVWYIWFRILWYSMKLRHGIVWYEILCYGMLSYAMEGMALYVM